MRLLSCFLIAFLSFSQSTQPPLYKFGLSDHPTDMNTPPFIDGKAAEPHYHDLIPEGTNKVTPSPTPPGQEPLAPGSEKTPENTNEKIEQLNQFRVSDHGKGLTTNQGVRIADNQNSLKVGPSGPTLLEDFHFLEKMSHFDRERIPERVVHARGSGAHGFFQCYRNLSDLTKAAFVQDPTQKTPVFVRFSTVQGFRGSADTVRDIRGFATKFYTEEGVYDLVGNDTPVFFVQDSLKFVDLVHAVKPEPATEMPQGQSAHDSFWDFVTLQPEMLHNVMWAMSDRGIPRSFRTLEGFGIHTFRFVNASGHAVFVKLHWRPVAGKASLVWDEAQQIQGRDPDFHRRDLWEAIEAGDYPEYELAIQVIPEEDEKKFGFDIMDPTKLIPEEVVPLQFIGKMTLNRNPDDFFAETEQIAFCPANIVSGIDFTEDPLLLGRVFSYSDTQRHRLGANFHQLPINRPTNSVHNYQRHGPMQMEIRSGANYEPNTISENWPREVPVGGEGMSDEGIEEEEKIVENEAEKKQETEEIGGGKGGKGQRRSKRRKFSFHDERRRNLQGDLPFDNENDIPPPSSPPARPRGGFMSYPVMLKGAKIRARSPSFGEYYSHPRLFWQSQTPVEQKHIVDAFSFELGKVARPYIRERLVDHLTRIDLDLATGVADQLGIQLSEEQLARQPPAPVCNLTTGSYALSLYKNNSAQARGKKVSVLLSNGFSSESLTAILAALKEAGVHPVFLSSSLAPVMSSTGSSITPHDTFKGRPSVLTDGIVIPGGDEAIADLAFDDNVHMQLTQALKHLKPLLLIGRAQSLLPAAGIKLDQTDTGIILAPQAEDGVIQFLSELGQHRVWDREMKLTLINAHP